MYQKYAMGIPLNRLENDFYRMGLVLPRANMAHWVIRCSDEWLSPIYNRIHEELLKCEILHMDETRIQVNKESGKKASSDSFMWVIRSGEYESIRATFFHYARTRGKMPNADFYNHPEVIDDLMPWSENLPQQCRLEQNNKKHFKK